MSRDLKSIAKHALSKVGYGLGPILAGGPETTLSRSAFLEHQRLAGDTTSEPKTSMVLGRPMQIFNGAAFCRLVDEIWCREIYRFETDREAPRVLDCGANIGVASIYFKKLYPKARVTAFEADARVHAALVANLQSFDMADVEAVRRAVWVDESELTFSSDPASTTGRIGGDTPLDSQAAATSTVQGVRLADYLNEPIDMLKMDIEGAETDVLLDCRDLLSNVKAAFVEYHSSADGDQRLDEVLALLREAGFRIDLEKEGAVTRHPLIQAPARRGFDLAVNIFARR
ncbi:31-O-demethyl-FK506 methyltransferase FkbM [Botrimarina colliarenosi]|uniref:31-O-demethyl-FK506 methyltransferase FkbM n=1 Tax=Botrimarina colliarenosi TaxID=2528001 RepID=A0A5C6AKY6_9BACT|nr:FkbM family methyltransferase [Botrimarina colliarenosi]TWU00138.1 31-O-demethyl-FK506 methyltransferase FkbM [Botrimarina colliarenosi]